jgi:hypothetical protein
MRLSIARREEMEFSLQDLLGLYSPPKMGKRRRFVGSSNAKITTSGDEAVFLTTHEARKRVRRGEKPQPTFSRPTKSPL